jgi:hypothetical protein
MSASGGQSFDATTSVSTSVSPPASSQLKPAISIDSGNNSATRVDSQSGKPISGTDDNPPLLPIKQSDKKKRLFTLPPLSQAPLQSRNIDARNALISATGREFGPDIALKVVPNIDDSVNYPDQYISKIITKDSSITEVLNILAFLLNNDEQRRGSIIKKFSYENHFSANTGLYWYPTNALFDITRLTTATSAPEVKITIPRTFLRRDESYELKDDIPIEYNQIQPLISACILQMINILENTREVFGGWAKLFKGMQGGSSKSKTKKTRRRH